MEMLRQSENLSTTGGSLFWGSPLSNGSTSITAEALLVPSSTPIEQTDSKHSSGATWMLPLPSKQSDALYAAFRIAGTPGNDPENNGLLIAMTPLDQNAP
jgi:hypothetical protein